jgi:hypothetical protein
MPHALRAAAQSGSRVKTLNMLAGSTPCAGFYRAELEYRLKSLRIERVLAIVFMPGGALFASLTFLRTDKDPLPILIAGAAVMIAGLIWYLHIRRETPRVEEELKDVQAWDQANGNLK